jgi:hypothetical protein
MLTIVWMSIEAIVALGAALPQAYGRHFRNWETSVTAPGRSMTGFGGSSKSESPQPPNRKEPFIPQFAMRKQPGFPPLRFVTG